jgi:hypothetical protein
MKTILTMCTAAALCAFSTGVKASPIEDTKGDFLNTFAGPHNADLDVVSAQAIYGSESVRLSVTLAGNTGTTANALYVWGVDRGGATDILNHLPNPVGAGVIFNSIVVVRPDGVGFVVLVNPDGTPAAPPSFLSAGAVTIAGDTISAEVPLVFLPSTGADIGDYGFNIWPRIVGIESNDQVADFAPDDAVFHASAVPEPASGTLLLMGLGLGAALLRSKKGSAP